MRAFLIGWLLSLAAIGPILADETRSEGPLRPSTVISIQSDGISDTPPATDAVGRAFSVRAEASPVSLSDAISREFTSAVVPPVPPMTDALSREFSVHAPEPTTTPTPEPTKTATSSITPVLPTPTSTSATPTVTATRTPPPPEAPVNLSAQARANGEILLTWAASQTGPLAAFNVYRAPAAFDDVAQAVAAATNVNGTTFRDRPGNDGTYFYRVIAVDAFNRTSSTSNLASAVADATPPKASIEYLFSAPHDPVSGRTGVGAVQVAVNFDEPLLTTPFLSISPDSGVPIIVNLAAETTTRYLGSFEIKEQTPSGTAFALLSARDAVGNRGTEILSGASLEIDTDGPTVTVLRVAPVAPIENDPAAPTEIEVNFELSEQPFGLTFDELSYTLSGIGRTPIALGAPTQTDENGRAWSARFQLPADAGSPAPENLSFRVVAHDDLGNPGDVGREVVNLFQVYTGTLPPLDPPHSLVAQALPAGEVALEWSVVEGAFGYQLYRAGPNPEDTAPLEELGSIQPVLSFEDHPGEDGMYRYAVATVRVANGKQAVSAPGEAVEVQVDSVAPAAPRNLALLLTPQGIVASWQAPLGGEDPNGALTYSLYRTSNGQGQAIDPTGLTPLKEGIVQLTTTDAAPSESEHAYAVTAIDAAGNASEPSNTEYLNPGLLPVRTLAVERVGTALPTIRWTPANASVVTYRVNVVETNRDIFEGSALSLDDTGYTGGERTYEVTAIDAGQAESLARRIVLPALRAERIGTPKLLRGVFNRLRYVVHNDGARALSGVHLELDVAGKPYRSDTFELPASSTREVELVVGADGFSGNSASLELSLINEPAEGERAKITRTDTIAVQNSALVLRVEGRNFVRGGLGEVRFTVENTSDVETDIVTARATGNQDSDEIEVHLRDADENELSSRAYREFTGGTVVTLPGGSSVARILPGGTFTSAWFAVDVPDSAPNQVGLVLDIRHYHYQLGTPFEASITGGTTTGGADVDIPPYTGELLSVVPDSSFGRDPIVLRGRAVEPESGAVVPFAPLDLVLRIEGFERKIVVRTSGDGTFEYMYTPQVGESGRYVVSVLFPGQLGRPEQGYFSIGTVTVTPLRYDVRLPRNAQGSLTFLAQAGRTLGARNVRFAASGTPSGVQLSIPAGADLAENQSRPISIGIRGDTTAPETGTFSLLLYCDSAGSDPVVEVPVSFRFSAALPAIVVTPNAIKTGVVKAQSGMETLTVTNKGFAPLTNGAVNLLSAPPWIVLSSASDLGTLEVGDSRSIALNLLPDATIAAGRYDLTVRVLGDDVKPVDVPVAVLVVEDGIGGLLFHASDIYTGTKKDPSCAENCDLIPGLAEARITIQNEAVPDLTQDGTTDTNGELLLDSLPSGVYLVRASAPGHSDVFTRVRVRPGVAGRQDLISNELFLLNQLVTVEWSVREITIEDRYQLLLQATFETDVPAPVVVLEPSGVELPPLRAGDVFTGELTLTNYGFVRADNVLASLPTSDDILRYEFLVSIPSSLEAKARLVIPYRITALRDLGPLPFTQRTTTALPLNALATSFSSSVSSGCGYATTSCFSYDWTCANGFRATAGTCALFARNWGSCGGTWSPPSGFVGAGSGEGGRGGGGSTGPTGVTLRGADCASQLERKCGVSQFKVSWTKHSMADNPGALLRINTSLCFKSGAPFDPSCCEFRQNAGANIGFVGPSGKLRSRPHPVKDDDYTNDDLVPLPIPGCFATDDSPGIPHLSESVDLRYDFAAEQYVFDSCNDNRVVASSGRHTAYITGMVPRTYSGVPYTFELE